MKREMSAMFRSIIVSGALALLVTAPAFSAAPTAALNKAKQEAEAKGFVFESSRDEIIAKAKKEGRMRAVSSLEPATIKAMTEGFRAEYPFLNVSVEELTGTDANQRFVLELKSGRSGNWDAAHLATDLYNDYPPYLKQFDVVGMAQQAVLRVPPQLVDPVNRNILASTSTLQVVAYNKKLLSPDKVPSTWEDFLKPEFKGQKFVADIRPTEIASLVPAW